MSTAKTRLGDTDKSQFIVHHNDAPNLDFRYGSGVYDKSTPHGTAYCKYSEEFNKQTELDILGILTEKRKIKSYDIRHTISKVPRAYPDTCTAIDVWKYEVMRNGKLITSDKPITTDPKYAKVPVLPCIISCSLFGSDSKYIKGIDIFCDNIKTIGLLDQWDLRIYIASPRDGDYASKTLTTAPTVQRQLLDLGVELVHVDNHNPNGYSLEGTFWRFLAIQERARVIIRDVDYTITAIELIALADWIKSGLRWHRLLLTVCRYAPMLAGSFGVIGGPDVVPDLLAKITHFPYKKKYGDDEVFCREYFLAEAIRTDNILTSYLNYPPYLTSRCQLHKDAILYPTTKYITRITGRAADKLKSRDINMPVDYNKQRGTYTKLGLFPKFGLAAAKTLNLPIESYTHHFGKPTSNSKKGPSKSKSSKSSKSTKKANK
jgi:hypothetical protein